MHCQRAGAASGQRWGASVQGVANLQAFVECTRARVSSSFGPTLSRGISRKGTPGLYLLRDLPLLSFHILPNKQNPPHENCLCTLLTPKVGLFPACTFFSLKFWEPRNVQKRKVIEQEQTPQGSSVLHWEKGMKISSFRDPVILFIKLRRAYLLVIHLYLEVLVGCDSGRFNGKGQTG